MKKRITNKQSQTHLQRRNMRKCHGWPLKLGGIMTNYVMDIRQLNISSIEHIHVAQSVTCFALATPCISQYHQFEIHICGNVYPHSLPSLCSEYSLWTSAIFPRIMHHFKACWSFHSNFIPNEVAFIVRVHTTLHATQRLQLLTDIMTNSMESYTHNLVVSLSV